MDIQELKIGRLEVDQLPEPLPMLTDKQARTLEYIFNFYIAHRDYPTHREIAAALKIKSSNAMPFVNPLIKKGYLERIDGPRRNIRLTSQALEKLKLMEYKKAS
jgi:DNA-binding MarR family transcriptional regulator